MAKYLDKSGVTYLWNKIKGLFTDQSLNTKNKTYAGAINEINTKVGNLTGAFLWKGKFDTLPAVTNYEAGNVVGVGKKEYVLTVTGGTKAWEEFGDEGSYLLKSVAEETYAKKTSIPTVNDPKVSIKMNGAEKGSFTLNQASAGEVDLGTVLTEHQDISGKVDKTALLNTLAVVDLSSTDIAVRKAALDDFKAKWLALGNTDLNGARFIGRFTDANGNTSIHERGKALVGEDTLLVYKQISPAFPQGFYGLSYIKDMGATGTASRYLYQIYVKYDVDYEPGDIEVTRIRDEETLDWLNRFVYAEAPSTYLKIADAASTYETKANVTETLKNYVKDEDAVAIGNIATANAITSIKDDLSPVLQEIDLTGTDADRKAKLDQFEADWKALTGADTLVGARFVGKFGITDDVERNVTGIMTYSAGDTATEANDNCFYGICNGYSFSKQKSQIAVKVSCKNGSLTITPLFSHLEAITIYTDNTPEHMQANLDNIAAYEANLQALGVDTTKGYMISIACSPIAYCGILFARGDDYYEGVCNSHSTRVTLGVAINTDGSFYATNNINTISEYRTLTTLAKQIIPAINEVNALAKSKQDALTSGTNIKTVNGQSLLGSGDIAISGGGDVTAAGDNTFTGNNVFSGIAIADILDGRTQYQITGDNGVLMFASGATNDDIEISGVATPTYSNSAANKSYVDTQINTALGTVLTQLQNI